MPIDANSPPPRLDNNDGPIKLTAAARGPFKFLKGRVEKDKQMRWKTFNRGVSSAHVRKFIELGLKPFLDKFGYTLGFTIDDCVAYCKQWVFAHVECQSVYNPKHSIQFLRRAHNGSAEEFDWFLGIISPDDWFTLCDEWAASQFLDDSDAGEKQRIDIPWFVWNLLALENSKAHTRFIEFMYSEEDYDDDGHYGGAGDDGLGSYGGDRRTL